MNRSVNETGRYARERVALLIALQIYLAAEGRFCRYARERVALLIAPFATLATPLFLQASNRSDNLVQQNRDEHERVRKEGGDQLGHRDGGRVSPR